MTKLAFERLPNEGDRDERLLENERRIEPEHAIAEPTKRAVLARISPAAEARAKGKPPSLYG